ncbi:MAG: alpha-2-macroglobulin family protein, partial [Armatimonadota bacterium]
IQVRQRSSWQYVLVECPLPSGFEVVERPNPSWDLSFSGIEVRDDRVGIFSRTLDGDVNTFDFQVRAEVPGELHVMPVRAYAMYAPQLAGTSPEARLTVR